MNVCVCNSSTHYLHITVHVSPASTGVPSCPVVDISTDPDSSLTVSMRAGHQRWLLPVWFQVVVSSANRLTRSFSTTANMTTIPPCQANDVHNISVHPCNAVGCNKGCSAYRINKTTSEGTTLSCISKCTVRLAVNPTNSSDSP